jgi:large subunit ribosomal protein L24e
MTKCSFCGREESPYKGVHLIKNDGSTSFFCSSKCRRNALNLKRDRKNVKWTEAYGLARQRGIAKEKREAESEAKKEPKAEENSNKK